MRKQMRNVLLTLALSLIVCFYANADGYQLKRMVIGSGGFVAVISGDYKASGIIGQLIIGNTSGTSVTGDAYKVYNGFWVPDEDKPGDIASNDFVTRGITNYPNPANNFTKFNFALEEGAYVTLRVYDVMGHTVATILDDYREVGNHSIEWNLRKSNGDEVASGSYMYELQVNPLSAGGNSSRSYSLRNVVMISK